MAYATCKCPHCGNEWTKKYSIITGTTLSGYRRVKCPKCNKKSVQNLVFQWTVTQEQWDRYEQRKEKFDRVFRKKDRKKE